VLITETECSDELNGLSASSGRDDVFEDDFENWSLIAIGRCL
jgi:hypothetical protein